MAKAIVTRYVGPTDSRGSRIIARAEGVSSVSIGYADELTSEQNHAAAASKLAARYGWRGDFVSGGMPDGASVVHVSDDGRLAALKGFVNDYRKGTWTGNPWAKPLFRACVEAIGRSYGYFGEWMGTPTNDDEASHLKR